MNETENKQIEETSSKDLTAQPLEKSTKEVAASIIEETDALKLKPLIQLFNLNMSKKNVLRLMSLNNLLDSVTDQMGQRLEKRSDEFSNTDLITYLKVIQDSVEKSNKMLNQIDDTPIINLTQNNNTININNESLELNRESRERVMDAVKAYLARVQQEETTTSPEDIIIPEDLIIDEIKNISEENNIE